MPDAPPDFTPMVPPHRDDPHPYFRQARACPVAQSPSLGAYLVTRYEDLRTVVDDPVTFSSVIAVPKLHHNPPEVVAELGGVVPEVRDVLIDEDPPDHARTRAVVDAAFSGARVRAQLPRMRARAHELLDALTDLDADRAAGHGAGHSVDLVTDYAAPLVETVVNAFIGLPDRDAPRIRAWNDALTLLTNPLAPVDGKVDAARSMRDYTGYLRDRIAERRHERREDLLSDLLCGVDDVPGLDEERVYGLALGARLAGHDTTRDAITSTVLILLQDPDIAAAVQADEKRVVPRLIEETLRRDAPHRGLMRITTCPVTLGGADLPAGAPLLLLFGAGNRDETRFPDPDTVDLDRPNVRDHLAFGAGVHLCVGAPLARAEIRVAVETLLERLPGIRLVDGYRPTYAASYFFRGLRSLPVTW